MGIKINIEGDDLVLNSVITSIIADALDKANFTNIMSIEGMILRSMRHNPESPNFGKKNVINELIDLPKDTTGVYEEHIYPTTHTLPHPHTLNYCNEYFHHKGGMDVVYKTPILIDYGTGSPALKKDITEFMAGKVDVRQRYGKFNPQFIEDIKE